MPDKNKQTIATFYIGYKTPFISVYTINPFYYLYCANVPQVLKDILSCSEPQFEILCLYFWFEPL